MSQKDQKKIKWAPKLLLAAAAILAVLLLFSMRSSLKTVTIANTKVVVEVVKTDEARARGLSGRSSLKPGHGMLFVFDQPGQQHIWMKDMQFSIDVLWIDEGGRVVEVVTNMEPGSYPQTYSSQKAALYVLEVPSGFINRQGIKKGNQVQLPNL